MHRAGEEWHDIALTEISPHPDLVEMVLHRNENVGAHNGDGHCSRHEGTLTPCSD